MNAFALLTGIVVDQPESPGGCCLLLSGFGVRVPDGALFPQVTQPANDLQAPEMILPADLTPAMTSTRQSVMATVIPVVHVVA